MKAFKVLAVLNIIGGILTGCAAFMKWNQGNYHMTADCSGLDEITCNPVKTSSSFCCDGHLGWSCNPFGKPAAGDPGAASYGRCEYSGDDRTDPEPFCGPLGCSAGAKRLDAGAE
jgi:hypothetical protein